MVQENQQTKDYLGSSCQCRPNEGRPNPDVAYNVQKLGVNVAIDTSDLENGSLRGSFLRASANIGLPKAAAPSQPAPAFENTFNIA